MAASVPELGGQDVPFADFLAVQVQLLEEHAEAVSGPDIENEIHIPAEDVGQLHGQIVAHAGGLAGKEQRTVDGGVGEANAALVLALFAAGLPGAVPGESGGDGLDPGRLVLQSLKFALVVEQDLEGLAGADILEILQTLVAGHQPVNLGGGNAAVL